MWISRKSFPLAILFLQQYFATVQNSPTNSGAGYQRCSVRKVREGETAEMTFFIQQEMNDINFATLTRGSAPENDILICDRKSPLECNPTSQRYHTDSIIADNRITLRIPNVTRAFNDKYVLKIYVNDIEEPPYVCHLHVQDDRTCPRGTWMCRNGTCISVQWRCDKRNDCGDDSDEQHCGDWVCPLGQWKCRNNVCISSGKRCDKRLDCSDSSDEENCGVTPETRTCPGNQWKCRNNRCIDIRLRCDERDNCGDRSDEEDCPEIRTCPRDQWKCRNNQCIDTHLRCDERDNCGDGSDEEDCPETRTCPRDQWKCRNNQCIDKQLRCDERDNCGDWSDEEDCDADSSYKEPGNGWMITASILIVVALACVVFAAVYVYKKRQCGRPGVHIQTESGTPLCE